MGVDWLLVPARSARGEGSPTTAWQHETSIACHNLTIHCSERVESIQLHLIDVIW